MRFSADKRVHVSWQCRIPLARKTMQLREWMCGWVEKRICSLLQLKYTPVYPISALAAWNTDVASADSTEHVTVSASQLAHKQKVLVFQRKLLKHFLFSGIVSVRGCRHLDASPAGKKMLYAYAKKATASHLKNLNPELDTPWLIPRFPFGYQFFKKQKMSMEIIKSGLSVKCGKVGSCVSRYRKSF